MKGYEQTGTRAYYRPAGTVTLEQAVRMIAEAVRAAREPGSADMLADTTALTGFGMPGVDRYEIGASMASAAGSHFSPLVVGGCMRSTKARDRYP